MLKHPSTIYRIAASTVLLLAQVSGIAAPPIRCALVGPRDATREYVSELKKLGYENIAIEIADGIGTAEARIAAANVRSIGVGLQYWIEVGRNPAMADAHPGWMASLQGHPEWRRLFPDAPKPADGEVIKNYPWTPIYYQETFDAHLKRIAKLLNGLPPAKSIFLNDLQAAPSACGCGNTFCRWTSDYGSISTATRLGNDAAGRFVAEVKKLAPASKIIPVWLTECEDDEKLSHCAGISCFTGACWYNFTEQLMPVAGQCDIIGAMLTYKALGKDGPAYGKTGGWINRAISSFAEMPPKRKGTAIPASQIIAVLQGWDATKEEIRSQIERCKEAGAAGYVVSYVKIDQSWEPRLYKVKAAGPQ